MKNRGKRIAFTLALCAALLWGTVALAGSGDYHTSQSFGQVRFASYTGGYDGYASVDGMGGVTASDAGYVNVVSKNASVWASASTGSQKLGSVSHGESLLCVTSNGSPVMENGFYAVEYKGKKGYINSDYVVLNTLEITLMESNVPAYSAPDTHSKKVGSLSKQTTYRVIGFYDNYYIINLRDAAAAYVPMSARVYDSRFTANYHAGSTMGISAKTNTNASLRTGPDSSYPEIRKFSSGTSLAVRDVIDGWYMVQDDKGDTWAFVSSADVTVN